ncbi:hypothetical protein Pcinc_024675 [Petrolisthes cinctipes]|uniref:Uncharacterized protein n=1 Tax=Petrolisthes cinctipes TaxID=88211 RepID=A0AAE1KAG9_PETCI|nr:hypothetical protein Pcinc_024675 [Petrolisthes cinctipes]
MVGVTGGTKETGMVSGGRSGSGKDISNKAVKGTTAGAGGVGQTKPDKVAAAARNEGNNEGSWSYKSGGKKGMVKPKESAGMKGRGAMKKPEKPAGMKKIMKGAGLMKPTKSSGMKGKGMMKPKKPTERKGKGMMKPTKSTGMKGKGMMKPKKSSGMKGREMMKR